MTIYDSEVSVGFKVSVARAFSPSTWFRTPKSLDEATKFFNENGEPINILLDRLSLNESEHRMTFYRLGSVPNHDGNGNLISGVLEYKSKAANRRSLDDIWNPGAPTYFKFKVNTSKGNSPKEAGK